MTDERIQTTINRIGARVCFIWYVLMLISIVYRTLILKQHPRDYWDFFAILLIGSGYGFIALATKGGLSYFNRRSLTLGIGGAIIVSLALLFIAGQIHSVVDAGAFVIGVLLPAAGLSIGIAYFLDRRWKRKEGIEDEK